MCPYSTLINLFLGYLIELSDIEEFTLTLKNANVSVQYIGVCMIFMFLKEGCIKNTVKYCEILL